MDCYRMLHDVKMEMGVHNEDLIFPRVAEHPLQGHATPTQRFAGNTPCGGLFLAWKTSFTLLTVSNPLASI